MEINPPKTACACPCGGAIENKQITKKTWSHPKASHPMGCICQICQCTADVEAYTGCPRECSVGDGYNNYNEMSHLPCKYRVHGLPVKPGGQIHSPVGPSTSPTPHGGGCDRKQIYQIPTELS